MDVRGEIRVSVGGISPPQKNERGIARWDDAEHARHGLNHHLMYLRQVRRSFRFTTYKYVVLRSYGILSKLLFEGLFEGFL